MRRTPTEVVHDAAVNIPQTVVFPTETAALDWARMNVTALLRHKLDNMKLPAAERDQTDPIDAGYVTAKDLGTRPRRQRLSWMDAMLREIAEACFCELVPLRGTITAQLIGRSSDRATALQLMASLVPTAEKLGQEAYLNEYHTHRRAGDVEQARGFKDAWHMRQVEALHEANARQREMFVTVAPDAEEAFALAAAEVKAYMAENFIRSKARFREPARKR